MNIKSMTDAQDTTNYDIQQLKITIYYFISIINM